MKKINVTHIPSEWEVVEWYFANYRFGLEMLHTMSVWEWGEVED